MLIAKKLKSLIDLQQKLLNYFKTFIQVVEHYHKAVYVPHIC